MYVAAENLEDLFMVTRSALCDIELPRLQAGAS